MTAVKAHLADAYIASANQSTSAVLFYGPDAGLVTERADRLAKRLAGLDQPPGDIFRFDDADLETEPDRLAIELQTLPMFGGRKIIRATSGRRINAELLKPLVQDLALGGVLIVEAGQQRPTDALRVLFEKAPHAAAVACYADEARDLEALVREQLGARGLSISAAARDLLVSRLGADRALSRGEIEKLALYASGKPTIDVDDVDAIVGDASELALDRITFAAASGDAATAVAECDRARSAGEGAQSIILAVQRHFLLLHRIRSQVDGGRTPETVVRGLRPPIHFKSQEAVIRQIRQWSQTQLSEAVNRIAATAKASRRSHALEDVVLERLVMELARMARAGAAGTAKRA